MPAPSLNLSPTALTLLLVLSVLWGGTFFFVEVALTALPPVTLVLARVALAAAALWTVVLATGRKVPRRREVFVAALVMGALNNVLPFLLIFWGQTQISGGLASILNATTPLFTVIVAHLFLPDEKASALKWTGVALGLAGVVVIVGPPALAGLGTGAAGQIAVLAAALSYAFAGVHGRRFRALGVDPLVTATLQVTASTLIMLPLAAVADQPWTLAPPPLPVSLAVLALALVSTALAYVLYFRILELAGATNLLLVTFLIPVTAILLGVTVLGETLLIRQIAGMALIGSGLIVMDGRLLPRRPRQGLPGGGKSV